MDTSLKMYCVFSMEAIAAMNGNRGKLTSMAGHAFLHTWWDAEERFGESVYNRHEGGIGGDHTLPLNHWIYRYQDLMKEYRHGSATRKISLKVATTEELSELKKIYQDKCGVSLVRDKGLTVFKEPTTVCLGIGPIHEDSVEETLRGLKVLI